MIDSRSPSSWGINGDLKGHFNIRWSACVPDCRHLAQHQRSRGGTAYATVLNTVSCGFESHREYQSRLVAERLMHSAQNAGRKTCGFESHRGDQKQETMKEKAIGCKCYDPLLLVIRPGVEISICPIHPERKIKGMLPRLKGGYVRL